MSPRDMPITAYAAAESICRNAGVYSS